MLKSNFNKDNKNNNNNKKNKINKSKNINKKQSEEFKEHLVAVNRVSKTVKGGRIFKFSALMVVGDGKGRVGVGMGKSSEIPDAIRKGIEDAKKHVITVHLHKDTIPHEVIGKFGATRVLLKPAPPGTGVLSGASARAVIEAAGIKDLRAKSLKSNNPCNVIKAVIKGLKSLCNISHVAKIREKTVSEILH